MTRSALKLHLENGFYYVVHRGNGGRPIFCTPQDYALFERALAEVLARYRARLHAFCWLPSAAHMLLQIAREPVGRIVQQLSRRYAREINLRSGACGAVFQRPHEAILIEPAPKYLLPTLRHIHEAPIRADLAGDPNEFARSSHAAYAAGRSMPGLSTSTMFQMLCGDEEGAIPVYREFLREPVRPEGLALCRPETLRHSRALCSPQFLGNLRRTPEADRNMALLERLIDSVAMTVAVERNEIASPSRKDDLALARALIAWHAPYCGIASLAEVARRLERSESSLREAIQYHRERRPGLFRPGALRSATPLIVAPRVAERFTCGMDT